MKEIAKGAVLDVEALTRLFVTQKRTKERFSVPVETGQAEVLLLAAYRAQVQCRGFALQADDETMEHLNKAARWLIGQGRTGLLFCGGCGNGKTTLLRALRDVIAMMTSNESYEERRVLRIATADEVVRISRQGDQAWRDFRRVPLLAVDDVGEEPSEVMDYGNVSQPMVRLLCYRYEEQLPTLLSTNLTPKELREHYGARVADRLNEMMDKIIFKQSSYRR